METIFKNVTTPEVSLAIGFNYMPYKSVIVSNAKDKVVINLNVAIIQYHILLGTQAEWLERLTANAKVATVCKILRSPGIDFKESIPPQAGTTNRVVAPARQAT